VANRKQARSAAAAESVRAEKEKATASVTGTDKKPAKKPATKKPVVKKPKVLPAVREAKAPMAKRAARVTKKASEGKPQVRTPGRIAKAARIVVAKKEGDATRAATRKAGTKLVPGVVAGAPTWARTKAGREMMAGLTQRNDVNSTPGESLNDPKAVQINPDAKPQKRVRPSGTSRTPKPAAKAPTQADVKKARSKNQKYRFRGN
jgi:hypothetical protein